MDTQKLAKIIKLIVEQELKKQLPILQENIKKELLKENKPKLTKMIDEIDPFDKVSLMLEKDRKRMAVKPAVEKEIKSYSKNPILNEILNSTKRFTDDDNDTTLEFSSEGAQLGMEAIRQQMAQKMGYGDIATPPSAKTGLGVNTGVAHMDKVLNRDYSELVKRFKK